MTAAAKNFTCEQIARAALGEPTKRVGAELLWHCPRHEDRHESLAINPRKNVFLCAPCHASGTPWGLAAYLAGLDIDDKAGVTRWLKECGLLNARKGSKRQPVATYVYTDADGNPVARKLRFEPKSFSWQHWEGGEWVNGLGSVKPPLYRLPEIVANADIIICEGEKDADTAAQQLGMCGTTGGSAADPWLDEYTGALTGKDCVVIPDADAPGRKKARIIARALSGRARSVRLLEMPGAKDLTEWVERGGTRDALIELVRNMPEWKPEVVDGAQLLDRVVAYIRRYVALSDSQARIGALFVVHTHAFEAADSTPYLAITSAEKQSGKSRLLEVLELVVANPWFAGRVTAAVLTRKIDAEQPTLLLDESDAAFGGEQEYAETLRGVLNTGYRRRPCHPNSS
jgi:DNA primase